MIQTKKNAPGTIRIAAAVLHNDRNQMLLVRKRGTSAFMQPGGKIGAGETAKQALTRELKEELRLDVDPGSLRYLGRFAAPAANEPDFTVEADVFEVRLTLCRPIPAAEIEEFLWVDQSLAEGVALAPLTRDEILPRYLAAK